MVFGFGKSKREKAFATKGLEGFTPAQQERILSKIGTKEAELIQRKEDALVSDRMAKLEKALGFGEKNQPVKGTLQKLKEFRKANFERRERRMREFNQKQKDFKEGKLAVKPMGMGTLNKNSSVKPIKLKAPPKGV